MSEPLTGSFNSGVVDWGGGVGDETSVLLLRAAFAPFVYTSTREVEKNEKWRKLSKMENKLKLKLSKATFDWQ